MLVAIAMVIITEKPRDASAHSSHDEKASFIIFNPRSARSANAIQ